jgi:RNA polymerase sigma-70 factor (ECF subfamily)
MGKDEIKQLTDYELVLEVLSDLSNYQFVIERYSDKLIKYIQRLIYVNREDAEDILQEVFIKTYRNLNSYNPKYKFSSWIYRITHNEAISFLRSRQTKIPTVVNEFEKDVFAELVSDVNLEDEYISKATSQTVHQVLAKLDTKYRSVLVLRFIEDMDYNEISNTLQISVGTVGSLINRAKSKFKELIESNE